MWNDDGEIGKNKIRNHHVNHRTANTIDLDFGPPSWREVLVKLHSNNNGLKCIHTETCKCEWEDDGRRQCQRMMTIMVEIVMYNQKMAV